MPPVSCSLSSCGSCADAIPHLVHQSWMTSTVPSTLAPLSARWRTGPAGWEHRLWTDDTNRQLWAAHFPELLSLYDGYPTPIQRADATRLLYMHLFGGVYADLDVAPCTTIWAVLGEGRHQLLLVRGPDPSHKRGSVQALSNFFMASARGHPFWAWAIRQLPERRSKPVMSATGPWFLNAAWNGWLKHIRQGEPQLSDQCARAWNASARAFTFDEWQAEVAAHHWMGTSAG